MRQRFSHNTKGALVDTSRTKTMLTQTLRQFLQEDAKECRDAYKRCSIGHQRIYSYILRTKKKNGGYYSMHLRRRLNKSKAPNLLWGKL
jgi:hypothetical protein